MEPQDCDADAGGHQPGERMMVMMRLGGPARSEHLSRLRCDVEAGVYRPPDDAVAEGILAWLSFLNGSHPT